MLTQKLRNAVYTVQCRKECSDLYTRETNIPQIYGTTKESSSSGQDLVLYLHLKEKRDTLLDKINRCSNF